MIKLLTLLCLILCSPLTLSAGVVDIIRETDHHLSANRIYEAELSIKQALNTYTHSYPLKLQWAKIMEVKGNVAEAMHSYQNILNDSRNDTANYKSKKIALTRLNSLLGQNPKLIEIKDKFIKDTTDLGNKALLKNQKHTAYHAHQLIKNIDSSRHLMGLNRTLPERHLFPIPSERDINAAIHKSNLLLVRKNENHAHQVKLASQAIAILKPYAGTDHLPHQEINYLMALSLKNVGEFDQSLGYYDLFLKLTKLNQHPHILKLRKTTFEIFPQITPILNEIYSRKKNYIANLTIYARKHFKTNPNFSSAALLEVFKIDPNNKEAQKIQNRIIGLGSTKIFERGLLKKWTLMNNSSGRSLVEERTRAQFLNNQGQILTMPRYPNDKIENSTPSILSSSTDFPGYGLLKAEFKTALNSNETVDKGQAFGFAIKNTADNSIFCILLNREPNRGRIAIRGLEINHKGAYKSLGALFVDELADLKDWITLEVLKYKNEYRVYVNKNSQPSLVIRYTKEGLDGAIGLYMNGNTIQVKDLMFTSNIQSKINLQELSEQKKLFNHDSLKGWWYFAKDINKAKPLRNNQNTLVENGYMIIKSVPGNPIHIFHEKRFAKQFEWTTQLTLNSNSPQSYYDFQFGCTDLEGGSYRLRLKTNKDKWAMELIEFNNLGLPKKLAQSSVATPDSSHKFQTLKISVIKKNLLVSVDDEIILTSTLKRSAEGNAGFYIAGGVCNIMKSDYREIK